MVPEVGRREEKVNLLGKKMVCRNLAAGAVWEIASARLRKRNENSFVQWFSKMVPLRIDGELLVLGVPDEFFGQLAEDCCGDFLADSLLGIEGMNYSYTFEVGYCAIDLDNLKPLSPVEKAVDTPVANEAESDSEQPDLFSLEEDPVPQVEVEAVPVPVPAVVPVVKAVAVAPAAPVASVPAVQSGSGNSGDKRLPRWNLNDATFENFIVSDDNNGAYTAARAVSEEPGALYNPLFIYGTNGIGKTHLLQAIGREIAFTRPGCVVKCTPCSDLVNDFYRIMSEHRSTVEFRDRLLESDVLLIDDVHGLAKKVQMQEEFFSVFNTLIGQGKQIVMTCDRQPCEIADIDKRLTTRFESGVICQIGMPEYEARMVILRMWRKNILTNTWLPDDVLEFLATNIRSSVRRLKSAFMTLSFHASLSGKSDLSVADAEEQLHAQIAEELTSRSISVEDIQRTVAEFFNLTIADLLGTKRTRNIAEPRMVAMALARELTSDSSTAVGAAFGRNHATILHAEKQVEQLCAKDDNMRRSVAQIKRKLQK